MYGPQVFSHGGGGAVGMPPPTNAGNTLMVRIPGVPFPIAFGDWVHDAYYHTVQFANADTATLECFVGTTNSTIPGGSRTMTEIDSNLPRSGESGLPQGYEGLIYSLHAEIVRTIIPAAAEAVMTDTSQPPDVATFFDIQRKLFVDLRYNNKSVSTGRLGRYPQAAGMHVVTQKSNQELVQNSAIDPRGGLSYVLPLWLRPDVGFKARMTPVASLTINQTVAGQANNATQADIQLALEGLLKRPVT